MPRKTKFVSYVIIPCAPMPLHAMQVQEDLIRAKESVDKEAKCSSLCFYITLFKCTFLACNPVKIPICAANSKGE